MNIHEYQAKEFFRAAGLTVPDGEVVHTVGDALSAANRFGLPVMVKAQVHTGGRGKAGGVKMCLTEDHVRQYSESILGMDIKGHIVHKLLVTPVSSIAEEYYLGMIVDRNSQRPLLMASAEGGMDIETVAKDNPDAIIKFPIDPCFGLMDHQALGVALKLSSDIRKARQLASAMQKLYRAFVDSDASLVEINPFIFNKEGQGVAIDAKMNIDDNSLFRHQDFEQLRDFNEEDAAERAARVADLSFVKLDGNVGCLVNGAGLAMATMDLVQYYGGLPANFLDIGGSSSPDKVVHALAIILRDPNVEVILFNIFGGITRCDDVARGIIQATQSMEISVPIVVRLTGTNEEEARKLLKDTELVPAATMDEAVQKALELAGNNNNQ